MPAAPLPQVALTQRRQAAGCGFAAAAALGLIAAWQLRLSFGYEWALSWLVVTITLLAFIPYLLVPILIDLGRHR